MSDLSNTRIGISGAGGLIGWHVRCRLSVEPNVELFIADRTTFGSPEKLAAFVLNCDAVVHLAGVNRGDDEEVESANPRLARLLVDAMERADVRPHLLFSSSTHAERDTPYGRSKRAATAIFSDWSERVGAKFSNLILPHIFGEHGRPFYNSVVSTFCHQLAGGDEPRIEIDGELELLHVRDVSELVLTTIRSDRSGDVRASGVHLTVSEMLDRVRDMGQCYLRGLIPRFNSTIDLQLFNTFRSYLFPHYYPVAIERREDDRGSLFEAVKAFHGGQTFFSTTRPGIVRGNHFHFSKVERFLVVEGEAVIRLRRLFDGRVLEFAVNGDRPCFVDIPTLHTHNNTNVGDGRLLTLFWSHEIFDPAHPDTYAETV